MTHKLIKTDNYLLVVDDSEIDNYFVYYQKPTGFRVLKLGLVALPMGAKNIISHLPLNGSPILQGVDLLPPIEDDVEQMVSEQFPYKDTRRDYAADECRAIFEMGYNKARQKYKYTDEDMRKALLIKHDGLDVDYVMGIISNKYPTEFECEMFNQDDLKSLEEDFGKINKPKTTTNAQGQRVWVGKYNF